MPTGQRQRSFNIDGESFNEFPSAVSFDSVSKYRIDLPAVSANNIGTLTTRTDDDTGVATLQTSQTIETADVCDVYWSGGCRYGMDATVSGVEVTLDGGAGDALPVATTAVTVVLQTEINPLNLDGDNAEAVAVVYQNASDTGAKSSIDLQDSGSASIEQLDLVHETANGGCEHYYDISNGDTNVFTGNPITKGFASHDSTTAAGILWVIAGIDSTP